MDYIYVVKSFESTRHIISHTDMYFKKAEHTYWAFHTPLNRVELIKVNINSVEYQMAVTNSNNPNNQ